MASEMMAQRSVLPGAGLILLALVGCSSTHTHTSWATIVEETGKTLAVSYDLPDPYKVVALSVKAPRGAGSPLEGREYRESLDFPVAMLETQMASLLEDSGAFSRIIRMNGASREDIRKKAKEAGAGLLLEVDLKDHYLAHIEGTPGATWCGLIWIFAGWGTHWWHDQIFEMDIRGDIALRDLVKGRWIGGEPLLPVCREEALCFHERSTGVGSYLLTLIWPPAWTAFDTEEISTNLLAASGTDVAEPLADVLGRVNVADVIRYQIPLDKDLPITFKMESPRDGMTWKKKIPLKLRVVPKETLADLQAVRLNDTVLWSAGGEPTPSEEGLLLEKEEILLKEGKAVLEFSLQSRPEPVRIEIAKVPEVMLMPRSVGAGGGKSSP